MLDRIIEEAPRFFTYYNLIFLGQAALTTLALTAVGCVGGFFFGFLMAALRQTRGWATLPLRALAFLVTELFRRIPFLVTLFVFFYTFEVLDLDLSVFWVATAAVVVIAAAFIAEIVRAGILAVSHGQSEAAYALGLRPNRNLQLVVLPQALRIIVPPLVSQYLNLTKNSSLAIAIGYMDIVATIGGISLMQTGKEMETMIIVLGVYLVFSLIISAFMNWFNRSIRYKER